jgi:hypothetical protein
MTQSQLRLSTSTQSTAHGFSQSVKPAVTRFPRPNWKSIERSIMRRLSESSELRILMRWILRSIWRAVSCDRCRDSIEMRCFALNCAGNMRRNVAPERSPVRSAGNTSLSRTYQSIWSTEYHQTQNQSRKSRPYQNQQRPRSHALTETSESPQHYQNGMGTTLA